MLKKMGLMFVKKMTLIFLIFSAFLFSAPLASSRASNVINGAAEEVEDAISAFEENTAEETDSTIHERLLRGNTQDYRSYDPAPTLDKPPYKVIQN